MLSLGETNAFVCFSFLYRFCAFWADVVIEDVVFSLRKPINLQRHVFEKMQLDALFKMFCCSFGVGAPNENVHFQLELPLNLQRRRLWNYLVWVSILKQFWCPGDPK